MGTARFGFNGDYFLRDKSRCLDAAQIMQDRGFLVRQQVSETPETFGQPGRLSRGHRNGLKIPPPAFAPCKRAALPDE
jgi:hypothetical protein